MKLGKGFMQNITSIANDWARTTRLQGGYWEGDFTLRGTKNQCMEWFHTLLGCHIEEYDVVKTWEGYVSELELNVINEKNASVEVTVNGYAHTLSWNLYGPRRPLHNGPRITQISVFVSMAFDQGDEFLYTGKINENAGYMVEPTSAGYSVWDVLQMAIEAGDPDGNPWRIYVNNENSFFYEQIDVTPLYYCYGDINRRRSLNDMENSIKTTSNYTATLPASIARYGRKRGQVDSTDNYMADARLVQFGWPSPKTISSGADIEIYNNSGLDVQTHLRSIKPCVMRDLSYSVGGLERGGWLTDVRDFVADEIRVSSTGITISTWLFDEAAFKKSLHRKGGGISKKTPRKMSRTHWEIVDGQRVYVYPQENENKSRTNKHAQGKINVG